MLSDQKESLPASYNRITVAKRKELSCFSHTPDPTPVSSTAELPSQKYDWLARSAVLETYSLHMELI